MITQGTKVGQIPDIDIVHNDNCKFVNVLYFNKNAMNE